MDCLRVLATCIQVLSEMLQRTGLLDELDISNVHSRWLWDTDEWEPAWMSEETLKRLVWLHSIVGFSTLHIWE